MDLGNVIEFVQQHGYIALFLSFYVCLLGLPIPNEVLVMTGGVLATTDHFQPIYTFFIVYITVILNATILYVIGRTTGNRLLSKLKKFEKINKKLQKASTTINRYGSYAAAICYFLPIVRHFIPFLMGSYRFSYLTFARFSYVSGFFWTLALYFIGILFHSKIDVIGKNLYVIGVVLVSLLLVICIAMIIRKNVLHNKVKLSKLKI